MNVADWSIVDLHSSVLVRGYDKPRQTALLRLATALTSAAAATGLVEVLIDRVSVPAMAGALGASSAIVTSAVAWIGTLAVSVTAVLVLVAVSAWSGYAWDRHQMFAVAASVAVISTVVAGLDGGTAVLVLHISVMAAAVAALAMGARRASLLYAGALWAVTLAVVSGQWSLSGLGGGATLASRAVGEASLVLAVVLLALAVSRSSHRGMASHLGLAAGAGLAVVSLASEYTPLVALWATGAMLWLPTLLYVAAAAAAGYLFVGWVVDRATRHLAAALILLLVAGIEPTLVHHSLTALLALVTLSAWSPTRGEHPWQ
jgi:hypothetical protein